MIDLFSKLSLEDRDNLITYIENYGTTHYEPLGNSLDYILRFWNDEKKTLYKGLGEKLIVSESIQTIMDIHALESIIETQLIYPARPHTASRFIDRIKCLDCRDFREAEDSIGDSYYNLVGPAPLATNRVDKPMIINFPNGKKYKVGAGAKVMKVLSKVADAFEIPGFEEFRLHHSQLLNEKSITGNLCFSIHPLDFLTMSDNNSNWSSCMRLIANTGDDESRMWQGEYSQGPVEMMNSPCVVIAYIDSHTPMTIKSRSGSKYFQWNNKKWRCLFIVNRDIIIPVRQYPYDSDSIEKIALDRLKTMIETNLGWKYTKTSIYLDGDTYVEEIDERIDFNFGTDKMYCDFPYDTKRNAYIGIVEPNCRTSYIDYSGVSECIICGKTDSNYESVYDSIEHWQPACVGCSGFVACCDCGEMIFIDEANCVDGSWYCSRCDESNHVSCEHCGEIHYYNNTELVYILHNFSEEEKPANMPLWAERWHYGEIRLCKECFNDTKWFEETFGCNFSYDGYSGDNYIDAKFLAEQYHKGNKAWAEFLNHHYIVDTILEHFPETEAEDS